MMKELGFSSGMYSQWKSGNKEPSKKSIEKIAEYFSTAPEYLQYSTTYPTNAAKAGMTVSAYIVMKCAE